MFSYLPFGFGYKLLFLSGEEYTFSGFGIAVIFFRRRMLFLDLPAFLLLGFTCS